MSAAVFEVDALLIIDNVNQNLRFVLEVHQWKEKFWRCRTMLIFLCFLENCTIKIGAQYAVSKKNCKNFCRILEKTELEIFLKK